MSSRAYSEIYKKHKFVGCIYRSNLQGKVDVACPLTELCEVIDLPAIMEFNKLIPVVGSRARPTEANYRRLQELLKEMQDLTEACPLRILAAEEAKS